MVGIFTPWKLANSINHVIFPSKKASLQHTSAYVCHYLEACSACVCVCEGVGASQEREDNNP